MAQLVEEIRRLPQLKAIHPAELERAAAMFEVVELESGQVFWKQGEAVDSLGLLTRGAFAASVDGVETGKANSPDVIGEVGAFVAGSTRSATLTATEKTRVLVLGIRQMGDLRWQNSPVYEVILDAALLAIVRRIKATNAKIARVATGGQAAPTRAEPWTLVKLWKTLVPGNPTVAAPPTELFIRRQPGLRESTTESISGIASKFVARSFAEGQVVFLEGDVASSMYIVAHGQVDVLRNVRGDRAELLASLRPGDQFGANTLIEKGPRTASCVAVTPTWLFELDAPDFNGMKGEVRRTWRESVLATLASQQRNANSNYNRAVAGSRGTEKDPEQFKQLMRASGFLEGLPADEDALLEEIQFVVDDDMKRNPKNRRSY
jgi:CRP-like cAMP-binding protein